MLLRGDIGGDAHPMITQRGTHVVIALFSPSRSPLAGIFAVTVHSSVGSSMSTTLLAGAFASSVVLGEGCEKFR
jgi:hypothetical protein